MLATVLAVNVEAQGGTIDTSENVVPVLDANVDAQGTLIEYTLQNVMFDDGGKANGTFSVDSISGLIQSADIITTAGSKLGSYSYIVPGSTAIYQPAQGDPVPTNDPARSLDLSDGLSNYLRFVFMNPLTGGGADQIMTDVIPNTWLAYGPLIMDSYECNNCVTARAVVGGEAVSVSEPPTVVLLGVFLSTVVVIWRESNPLTGRDDNVWGPVATIAPRPAQPGDA